MGTIRTYRHSPDYATDPDGTLVDTEEDADGGAFSVSVDTTGWSAGAYEVTVTNQDTGRAVSAHSNALALTVTSPVVDGTSFFDPVVDYSAVTANSDATDGVTLGFDYQHSANGQVTALKFYAPSGMNLNQRTLSLWSVDGTADSTNQADFTLLGQATIALSSGYTPGWFTATLASSISVTSGTRYRVGMHATGGAGSYVSGFPNPNQHTPPSGFAFVTSYAHYDYTASTTAVPVSSAGAPYGLDVEFVAA